jgi:outer membrane protein assembly factor BamB/nitrous oxidase accessory protein NosD
MNETARREIYYELQRLYHEDCPSVPLFQPIGHRFERDWVQGWYYNPLLWTTNYFYVQWKGGMVPSTTYSWPMFKHDLMHTGNSESPAPNTNQTVWNFTTGGYVYSPVVVDSKVYVGSGDKNVYCLDALTGTLIWNYTTGDLVLSSPAVVGDKVYVGSYDKNVYCLDASTGARIWNYTTGSWVFSSPAVADGRVYVGSSDNKVYCLDASTGAHIWNYTTGYYVTSSPAVIDGKVYVGSYDNKTYCLDALTGAQIWNYTTGNFVASSPLVVDGKVYVGSDDYNIYCLVDSTGALVWNYTTGSSVFSSPAVADGRVYVGSSDSRVYCLDAFTGAHIWDFTTGYYVASSPAVADGKVYVGSYDSRLYCLNASTGARIWSYKTGIDWVHSSPAVADGVVFTGSDDGTVYAFGNVVRAQDYRTIQAAIDAAPPGATIWIAPGIYNESLVINKTLTLVGKVGSSPIFSGGGSGTAITLLAGASGSIIAGIVITNWDRGILVANSANCKIYDNIMSVMKKNGITVEGSNAASNLIYSNIFQENAIAINLTASSAKNTIYKNIVTSNAIGLKLESGGNVIYANSIAQNEIGINVSSSNGNIIYHNNFIGNKVQISNTSSTSNTWDNGYPSGGNYWGECAWVDKYKGSVQNQPGSDGVNDTGYAIDQNNIDRYPLLQPFSRHDIGITNVLTSKTVVAKGFTLYVDVRILNYGVHDETFTVTVYANTTIIGKQTITVATRNSATVTIAWNTAGIVKANYTISAVVDVLPDETDWLDNVLTDGTVTVTIPGDVTSDIWVDMQDISILIDKFMATPTDPRWDPNCDINCDLAIDMADISIAIDNFMQSVP